MKRLLGALCALTMILGAGAPMAADEDKAAMIPAPDRTEGEGPFERRGLVTVPPRSR